MFDNFTFGAITTSYPQPEQEDREISPSNSSIPGPASQSSSFQSLSQIAGEEDIISRFARQSLVTDELENERPQRSFCMMDVEDEFSPDKLSYLSTTRGMTVVSANTPPLADSGPNGGCRRLKRQHNMQIQTSTSHIKDISALVENMVTSESQCVLRQPSPRLQTSTPSPPPPQGQDEPTAANRIPLLGYERNESLEIEVDDDEGFAEMEDGMWNIEDEMTLRRASTPSGIRKYHGLKWRRSFETAGLPSSTGAPARMKVRSVPRMRRRKPKTVPE